MMVSSMNCVMLMPSLVAASLMRVRFVRRGVDEQLDLGFFHRNSPFGAVRPHNSTGFDIMMSFHKKHYDIIAAACQE